MVMPERNFSSENYGFGFNNQEKVDEISGNGNHNTALFWEYDNRLSRRWNMDPKPNSSLSVYSTFSNNPIWFSDLMGDTIIISNKLRHNEGWMKKYSIWANSKEGTKFLKKYEAGGKYGYATVTFDVGQTSSGGGGLAPDATTSTVFSSKVDKRYSLTPQNEVRYANGDIVARGESYFFNLHFKITLNEEHGNTDNTEALVIGAETILHETQHIEINRISLTKYRMILNQYTQHHDYMKPVNGGWYNQRYDFYIENKSLWYSQYLTEKSNGTVQNESEFIKRRINDFFD